MSTAEIDIDAAVICDDVRREVTGKAILIGVWPLELTVPNYPTELFFCFHVEGAVIQSGQIEPRLVVRDEVGGTLFDSDVTAKMEPGQFVKGRFSIDFNVVFAATRSGDVEFIVTMGGASLVAAKRRIELLDVLKKEREAERATLSDNGPAS
ncbi:hypothetical protein MKK69_16460 [Methylobacterium sp. J-026]|uniref:hypothetical protein n=1 Tax=Methylobacterium sp. J-026 TaxID=2836624 RepID=UPI001FBB5549|nr:hypothetical protein [Methylobacterium sp. J-026]MCJ2135625.1 hypothetical protein [Methylobacterium sp. J-026]